MLNTEGIRGIGLIDESRLRKAYTVAADNLCSERVDGHWIGQLSTSALSTATAVSALSAVRKEIPPKETDELELGSLIENGVSWLVENQNQDGGWGDTQKSYSNISTTMLAIACFHFAGHQDRLAGSIEKAREYVDSQGGVKGLRLRYGRDKTFAVPILANCAMAGTEEWKQVSTLPFEAACVPQKFYHLMQLPVVSYAIPALVAIGQAKFFHDPPWNPITRWIRKWSVNRSLEVLRRMQPASGGFLEAIPLTSFVVMGLATTGRANHAVVQNGVRFIRESVLEDGSWPIDTNLATWTTTLSINSLSVRHDQKHGSLVSSPAQTGSIQSDRENGDGDSEKGLSKDPSDPKVLFADDYCLNWIFSCQNKTIHPFTNSPPGGWGWTDLSGAVPDADDTPGALLALDKYYRLGSYDQEKKRQMIVAARSGVEWLLKLQNRDSGWPTFCRGWGKLPFDRSGADITAHCMRGINAWKDRIDIDSSQVERAISGGLKYLARNQNEDGSWLPLWFGNQDEINEENPVYGTAKVLAAYFELGLIETDEAARGLDWIETHQNSDGSWGGGAAATKQFGQFSLGSIGTEAESSRKVGTIEETALATEALLFKANSVDFEPSIVSGLEWLVDAVESDCYRIDSPIGFYFAKLWYHEKLYPQVFAVSALGRALLRRQAISQ